MSSRESLRHGALLSIALVLAGILPTVTGAGTKHVAAASYSSTVISDSPSIYYRFGESSGTTASDSLGNGYNGTYTSYATLGTTGAIVGDSDTAVSTSGGAAVTYTGGSGLPTGNSSHSLEAWFHATSGPAQIAEWGVNGCKSFNSMGGICTILWVLFALVLSFHISLEALTKPEQGVSSQKECVHSRPHNCIDSAHGIQ